MHKIEQVMVTQFPFIPVTEGVDWFQYDTCHFTGWPMAPIRTPSRRPTRAPDMALCSPTCVRRVRRRAQARMSC